MALLDQINNNNNNGHSNRVVDSLRLYAEQEAQLKIFHPTGGQDAHATALKLQHYTHIYNAYHKNPSKDERKSLRFVRSEINNLKARLNPTLINRILYSRIGNKIRNYITGKGKLCDEHDKSLASLQKNMIQENNLQLISESLKKAGFSFQIDGALKKMMDQGFPQFHLPYADVQNTNAYYILHFNKLPGTNQYYFEKFDAVARPTLDSLLNRDSSCVRHTFSQVNGPKFTAGEAARLVNGKFICKTIDGKDSWLSVKLFDVTGNEQLNSVSFNLEKALAKLPLAIKNDSTQYDSLVQSLKNGKSKEVALIINDTPVKYTLDAAPHRKTIDVLDRMGQLIDTNKLLSGQSARLAQQIIETQTLQTEEVIDLGELKGIKIR